MSRRSKLPRYVAAQLRRLGLGGQDVWVPAVPEVNPLLVSFLQRAEDRVYVTRDARRARVRPGWLGLRQEAERARVSSSTIHAVMHAALTEIATWWRAGERERVERVWASGGDAAYRAYQRYRLAIASTADSGGADRQLLEVAVESIAASWWRQRFGADEFALVEEAARLALLATEPGVDMELEARCAAARAGLPAGSWFPVLQGVEKAVRASAVELETRRRRRRVASGSRRSEAAGQVRREPAGSCELKQGQLELEVA